MSLTSKAVIGGVIILAGVSVLLNLIGIHIGSLIGMLFAGLMIVIGIRKIQQGKKIFGGGVLLFGLLFLLGAAHLFFQILFAFIILMVGFKLLTRNKEKGNPKHSQFHVKTDSFDEEWKQMMHDFEK